MEYLLGQYCGIDDEELIKQGVEKVKGVIRDNYVNRADAEVVKSKIRFQGSYKIIDKITVSLNDGSANVNEANFSNLGLKKVPIADALVMDNPKLLSGGGVWCILDIGYNQAEDVDMRWMIMNLKPIQVANVDVEEYQQIRKEFTTTIILLNLDLKELVSHIYSRSFLLMGF